MFIFFGAGTGIAFLLLGPFIIIGGLRRPRDRKRLVWSGFGSMVIGLGNLLMRKNLLMGLALVGIGLYIVIKAAFLKEEEQES
ncbi:MAG: hypothetical protein QHI38_06130 [Armatimonadota bacterium]|nr:hypothetical protein [Armatimonadota bacterium]